jgi:hypothetical protein
LEYSIIPGGSQRGWPQKTLYFQIFVEIPRRLNTKSQKTNIKQNTITQIQKLKHLWSYKETFFHYVTGLKPLVYQNVYAIRKVDHRP